MKTVALIVGFVASVITILAFVSGNLTIPSNVSPISSVAPQEVASDDPLAGSFGTRIGDTFFAGLDLAVVVAQIALIVAAPLFPAFILRFAFDLLFDIIDVPGGHEVAKVLAGLSYFAFVWIGTAIVFPYSRIGNLFWMVVSHA